MYDPIMRTAEVAAYLKLDIATVQELLKSGVMRGERKSVGKNSSWRIKFSEVLRIESLRNAS